MSERGASSVSEAVPGPLLPLKKPLWFGMLWLTWFSGMLFGATIQRPLPVAVGMGAGLALWLFAAWCAYRIEVSAA